MSTKKKRSKKAKKSTGASPTTGASASSGSDDITLPQAVGLLVALIGISVILGAISDLQKNHPWWLFWIPGVDVIGIVAGLYLTFAGLVVLIVPENERGDAISALL